VVVYAALCITSTFIWLPLAPFAHRMHGFLTYIVFAVFVLTTLCSWMLFPFIQASPMRFYFTQFVDLDGASGLDVYRQSLSMSDVTATSSITGLDGYINQIVAAFPSARSSEVSCKPAVIPGLTTCKWEVGQEMLPSPGGEGADEHWIQVNAKRLNRSFALISLKGRNTRGCRIDFDTPIREYDVRGLDGKGWAGQVPIGYNATPRNGVEQLLLWSRTWDRPFEVQVRWDEDATNELTGRVTCSYAEYASGAAGGKVPENLIATIPAFEELLRFTPNWAVVGKFASGIAEVSTKFRV